MGNSRRYEFTPLAIDLPAFPKPASDALARRDCKNLRISGIETLPTSLDEAVRQTTDVLKHYKRRVNAGDPSALLELLDINPRFIAHRWVCERYLRLYRSGRLHRRRGRPKGQYKVHPLTVFGLVNHLCSVEGVLNPEQAFGRLEELGIVPYSTAKRLCLQVTTERRFQAFVSEFPSVSYELDERAAEQLNDFETLTPGSRISRCIHDETHAPLEITIEAK